MDNDIADKPMIWLPYSLTDSGGEAVTIGQSVKQVKDSRKIVPDPPDSSLADFNNLDATIVDFENVIFDETLQENECYSCLSCCFDPKMTAKSR